MELVLLGSASLLGCQVGELNEAQEEYLERELERNYASSGDESSATSAGAEPTQSSSSTSSSTPSMTSMTSSSTTMTSTTTGTPTTAGPGTEPTDTTSVDSTSAPGSSEVPACAIQIFQTTCAGSACHYGSDFRFQPDFTSPDIYELLTTGATSCASATTKGFIDLASPQDSYLLTKVRGDQPSGCGSIMPPPPADGLTAAQLSCLEDWIGSL